MRCESAVEVCLDSLLEHRPVEGLRVSPERLGLEASGVPLEVTDGEHQIIDRLPFEENPRRGLRAAGRYYGLQGATLAQGDHRASRRHGLERRNPEVLDRGEQERATARVEIGDLRIAASSEKFDMRAGEQPESTFSGA